MKDRQRLASINNRLREIERRAGHRRFARVVFNNVKLNFASSIFAKGGGLSLKIVTFLVT